MIRAALAAAALLLATQPAIASGPIEITQGEPFDHTRTGTVFPGEIAGLQLNRLHDFSDDQFDVSAVYGGTDSGDEISVYLYRAGLPDVSLWFGPVQRYMMMRQKFTPVEGADLAPRFFAPAGSTVESAMRLSYATEGGDIASTGAVLMQRGEWLFKIRASSQTRSVAELDALIDATLAAFPKPEGMEAPKAYSVAPCPDVLGLPEARPVEATTTAAIAAIFGSVISNDDLDGASPATWCRDAGSPDDAPIFRSDERTDAYVVAYGDAGTVVSVGAILPGDIHPDVVPVFYRDSMRSYLVGLFETAPTPQQAIAAADAGYVLGSFDRDDAIELNVEPE